MNIKTADYTPFGGEKVEYDADAPCWMCGLPVIAASMGGTVVCPWCDCGKHRDGTSWTTEDAEKAAKRFRETRNSSLTTAAPDQAIACPKCRRECDEAGVCWNCDIAYSGERGDIRK